MGEKTPTILRGIIALDQKCAVVCLAVCGLLSLPFDE